MTSFELASAIIGIGVLWFIYDASQRLNEEKHMILRLLMFYGAIALGWAMINYGLALCVDAVGATSPIYHSFEIVYLAYSTIGSVTLIYIFIIFIKSVLMKFLGIAKTVAEKKDKLVVENENEW